MRGRGRRAGVSGTAAVTTHFHFRAVSGVRVSTLYIRVCTAGSRCCLFIIVLFLQQLQDLFLITSSGGCDDDTVVQWFLGTNMTHRQLLKEHSPGSESMATISTTDSSKDSNHSHVCVSELRTWREPTQGNRRTTERPAGTAGH